jgi:hypothetical protein
VEVSAAVDNAMCDGRNILRRGVERLEINRRAVRRNERELQARGAGVDDENAVGGQYGQVQSRISGSSSPCSRV